MPAFNQPLRPFNSETLTVSNIVKQLTASLYNDVADISATRNLARKARGAIIENTSANALRYTEDGTTPVAALTGRLMNAGDTIYVESYQAISNFKMIRDTASDATISVEYFR